jgi:hypothetical protein
MFKSILAGKLAWLCLFSSPADTAVQHEAIAESVASVSINQFVLLEAEVDHAFSLERRANRVLNQLADTPEAQLGNKTPAAIELLRKAALAHLQLAERYEFASQTELDSDLRWEHRNQSNIHMESYGILQVKAQDLETILFEMREANVQEEEIESIDSLVNSGIYGFPNKNAYQYAVSEAHKSSEVARSMAASAKTAAELNFTDLMLRRAAAKYLTLAQHHRSRMQYHRAWISEYPQASSKAEMHARLKDEFNEKYHALEDRARSIRPSDMIEFESPKYSGHRN